ncbi:MAG: hypothetical protein FWF66_00730 [Candidatus Bathyarchaeota archaeon]|nr:hypothetical protein [Candidatus Termiticorpusculum sp.]
MVFHCRVYSFALIALLVGLSLFSFLPAVEGQGTAFSTMDVFDIPAVNGSIRFSVNGSYTNAFLENDMWIFNNLTLSGSRFSGTLKFSAKNCDVTIHSFTPSRATSNSTYSSCSIRYTVESDAGEQVINLGGDPSRPSHYSEWTVFNQDSVFFGEGKTWKLLPDETVIVKGLSGRLTVMRYSYGSFVDDRAFYLRHSVSITTGIIVALTVTLATVIKLRSNKKAKTVGDA